MKSPIPTVTFAGLLLAHRERLDLTQAGAARLLDVSLRLYCYWESGERTPLVVTQEGCLRRLVRAVKGGQAFAARCALARRKKT